MSSSILTHSSGLSSPARRLLAITKSADTDLPEGVCRALLVGTAGTANLVDALGNTCTNVPLQVGYNPIMIKRLSTGGTAADIWALY